MKKTVNSEERKPTLSSDSGESPFLAQEQRGLVILSVLINFIDWLDVECEVGLSEIERGKLVKKFLDAHQEGESYFMQAEQIADALGVPFATAQGEK